MLGVEGAAQELLPLPVTVKVVAAPAGIGTLAALKSFEADRAARSEWEQLYVMVVGAVVRKPIEASSPALRP